MAAHREWTAAEPYDRSRRTLAQRQAAALDLAANRTIDPKKAAQKRVSAQLLRELIRNKLGV